MHLVDVTNSYSDLVHSQLNSTNTVFVKVYSLGNTLVVYTESDSAIGIVLENHVRRIRKEEIDFTIKQLVKKHDSTYQMTLDKESRVVEIHFDK